jgi:hypothetical protein
MKQTLPFHIRNLNVRKAAYKNTKYRQEINTANDF